MLNQCISKLPGKNLESAYLVILIFHGNSCSSNHSTEYENWTVVGLCTFVISTRRSRSVVTVTLTICALFVPILKCKCGNKYVWLPSISPKILEVAWKKVHVTCVKRNVHGAFARKLIQPYNTTVHSPDNGCLSADILQDRSYPLKLTCGAKAYACMTSDLMPFHAQNLTIAITVRTTYIIVEL